MIAFKRAARAFGFSGGLVSFAWSVLNSQSSSDMVKRGPQHEYPAAAPPRLRQSVHEVSFDTDDDMPMIEDSQQSSNDPKGEFMAVASGARAGGSRTINKKETPLIPRTPVYSFPETFTVSCPVTYQFTVCALLPSVAREVNFDLNDPVQPLKTTITDVDLASQVPRTDFGWPVVTNVKSPLDSVGLPIVPGTPNQWLIDVPKHLHMDGTIVPANLRQWFSMYEYYGIIGCEYNITVTNRQTHPSAAQQISWIEEVQGTGTSKEHYYTNRDVAYFRYHPNVKTTTVGPFNTNNTSGITHINGYMSGQKNTSNVVDDDQVKTWYSTMTGPGSNVNTYELPQTKNRLTLLFYKHNDNVTSARGLPTAPTVTPPAYYNGANSIANVHVEVTLNFKIQCKDLRQAIRYPAATGSNSVTIVYPRDIRGFWTP